MVGDSPRVLDRQFRLSALEVWGFGDGAEQRLRAFLARDAKAILTPPSIFPLRFSIQNMQGGVSDFNVHA